MQNIRSGPIRQSVGQFKRHLKLILQTVDGILKQNLPDTTEECTEQVDKLSEFTDQIKDVVSNIKQRDGEWLSLIQRITDDEKAEAEEAQYAETATSDDGYQTLILTSSRVLSEMSTRQRKLQRVIDGMKALQALADPNAVMMHHPLSAPPHVQPHSVNINESQSNHPQSSTTESGLTSRGAVIKYPKLELPKFNGDILRWKQFWSVFRKNIHDRAELTGTEKFSYLLSLLSEEVSATIDGLIIDDDNYGAAVDILHQIYDRSDDRLISLLYGELKKMPQSNAKKEDKRKVYNHCERIFRHLESAGQDLEANSSLVMDYQSKFPDNMIRDLQRYYKISFQSKLSDVRSAVEKSISELELTGGLLDDLASMRPGSKDDKKPPPQHPHGSGNDSNRSGYGRWGGQSQNDGPMNYGPISMPGFASNRPLPYPCVFCSEQHWNRECKKFPSASKRTQRLLQLGRCTRCCQRHDGGATRCQNAIKCMECKSQNNHCTTLCPVRYSGNASTPQPQAASGTPPVNNGSDSSNVAVVSPFDDPTVLYSSSSKRALFQSAKVRIVNPVSNETCVARLCLDTLSNRSYITEQMAQNLHLIIKGSEKLSVSVFGSQRNVEVPSHIVNFGIIEADGNVRQIEANTTRIISKNGVLPSEWPASERALLDTMKRTKSLADDFDDPNSTMDILIGADYAWEFIIGAKLSTHTQLSLIPTTLGFMLAGRLSCESTSDQDHSMFIMTETACQLPSELGMLAQTASVHHPSYPDVDEYWKLETIGINDDPVVNDDDKAIQMFRSSVYFEDGRYHVRWPWIQEKKVLLPSNQASAERRFRSLSKRLSQTPELLHSYSDILQLQIDRGIIEHVPVNEIQTENTVHYLPHHPVVKSTSSTTKIRIVYDASAKPQNTDVCLNECMFRGPVILPDLCRCLIKFRTHQTVVISDIEKAFLQVALHPVDRDVTRFFWYKDTERPLSDPENLAVYRFRRVAFGIISSPFLLGATIQHHLSQENTDLAKRLMSDVYVDNIISGLKNSEDSVKYYKQSKEIFRRAGMNLVEFCSNSSSLMNLLPSEDRIRELDARVLGLKWDSQNDDSIRITKSGKWKTSGDCVSKRDVLQAIASVFDPLGLFQPVMLNAKLLLQRLWQSQVSWDQPVDSELAHEWAECQRSIEGIFGYRLPRFVGESEGDSTLIVFSDASSKAYAATVYLRVYKDSCWCTNLIFAKSRLAPVAKKRTKQMSLPRLELLGALIGIRAARFCRQAFDVTLPIHAFIDSECVLHWIRAEPKDMKRFVASRIEEIRGVDQCTFHYVRSEDNPADINTRGKLAADLIECRLWWHGPSWLQEDEESWAVKTLPPISTDTLEETLAEARSKPAPVYAFIAHEANPKTESLIGIQAKNYSSFPRLVRITAHCLKFLNLCIWAKLSRDLRGKHARLNRIFLPFFEQNNSTEVYGHVKNLWVVQAQYTFFGDVFASVNGDKPHYLVAQLGVRIDDQGLLRSHSRFANADLPKNALFPKLLPSDSMVTILLIKDVHCKLLHAGVSHTLSQLRREFWIPKGRAVVRKVLNTCLLCRRFRTGTPFARPTMPPWPVERVSRSFPFQHVGLDYFGPMTVNVNQERAKMWACLFTCLTTRAVHIEAVTDCSSPEFLNAIIRFISRRGCPETIVSDNAAQFHLVKILADESWESQIADESITSFLAQHDIKWNFIIELAPWQGGHYERLVGIVKSLLKVAIGRRILSWSDLVTLLAEAEAVVNSRPITYVYGDRDSQARTLRPADFITDLPITIGDSPPSGEQSKRGEAGKVLLSVWKQRQRYLDKVWEHWYGEYLLSLRETGHAIHQSGRSDKHYAPRLGEVVLLQDTNLPRNSWKLAKIMKLLVGDDGRVRGAEIQLSNGVKIRRPVNHLIPLEVEVTPDGRNEPTESHDLSSSQDDPDDFFGFSPADVQRTIDNLQRFDAI